MPILLWNYMAEKDIAIAAFCSNIFWFWKQCFSTKLLVCIRGNKKNRYSRIMFYFWQKKQLDSLSSITGGSSFVWELNSEERNINSKTKKIIPKHRSQYYQYEWHLAISLQIFPERGVLRIHYFISIHDCYFEPLGWVGSIRSFFDFIQKIRTILQAFCVFM